jgi:hypothetical protein
MPVGCVHQIPQRLVAKWLNDRAIHFILETDESPGSEQRLAQV